MTNPNDKKDNNSNAGPNELLLSNNTKSVIYAEHIASLFLQTSIHAPSKHTKTVKSATLLLQQLTSTQDKGKGQTDIAFHSVIDQVARDAIIKITKDLNKALH